MSNNVTRITPADYTTSNIVHRYDTSSVVASAAFTLTSPPSPTHSLKRRRQFGVDYNSEDDTDDEEKISSVFATEPDYSDEEDENKENVPPPRKRLCLDLEASTRLRAAELSSESGRSSRSSWTSDSALAFTLLTPPDSPRIVLRPFEQQVKTGQRKVTHTIYVQAYRPRGT